MKLDLLIDRDYHTNSQRIVLENKGILDVLHQSLTRDVTEGLVQQHKTIVKADKDRLQKIKEEKELAKIVKPNIILES